MCALFVECKFNGYRWQHRPITVIHCRYGTLLVIGKFVFRGNFFIYFYVLLLTGVYVY
jgi:hypothetical protein